ncbi:MAG: TlpA family protein disulfide reductase, partial [Rhodoferax sp.]|nr:TlpA family protein disulfide reductase [Rhodoferax sp.]
MAGKSRRQALALLLGAVMADRSLAGSNAGARWRPWPADRATPALRLPDLDDHGWDLAQEAGRPLLLNFWATWCEPCRAEMQSFEVLEQRFQAQRLKVLAINFKEGREPVRRFRETQGLSLA